MDGTANFETLWEAEYACDAITTCNGVTWDLIDDNDDWAYVLHTSNTPVAQTSHQAVTWIRKPSSDSRATTPLSTEIQNNA